MDFHWLLEHLTANPLGHLWVLLLGTPAKFGLWLGNRLTTYTGMFLFWRRLKDHPKRTRTFLVWGFVINTISLGLLTLVVWFVWHRA